MTVGRKVCFHPSLASMFKEYIYMFLIKTTIQTFGVGKIFFNVFLF